MASTSTSASSIPKSFKYDVFLSFRGDDTRNNFVSHLYNALVQNGIQTYKDDEKIEKGKTIDTQLIRSIEDSRFYIIVFSKNYASSSWCLDELVNIMECRKASEQSAYPVFYDVEPTEVRKQSGLVREAFRKHEHEEAAGKWREALKEAADLAGWESKKTANGDESKLIQLIVDDIFKKVCSGNLSVDTKLVGMETRIEAFLSSIELDVDDVRMIGIWGMGGGGKTTLARAVFDRISTEFDGIAFVENVREVSRYSFDGLNKLQQQVIRSVLSKENITLNSVHEGTNMMKKMMRGRKVLIVLDDVDDTEQLEALAGEPNWFKLGSRVIITTRDKQVLLAHRVKFIYNVNLLSHAEAISLFSKYAFIRDIPIVGYEELSKQVVQYADGLPLTIKVLGSLLNGQNMPQWIDTLERLKKIPLKATMEKLELSYNGLEDDYKEIFLDVACFLKGWRKDNAIRALESCGFFAEAGLRVLEQKSLVTISIYGLLGMHDHIEEMGKNIVRRVSPNEPTRHSRLWIEEEIVDILANDSGTQSTKCIYAHNLKLEIFLNGLANMNGLRFLHVNTEFIREDEVGEDKISEDEVSNSNSDEFDLHLPNALRFLRWEGYPFSNLPKTFQAKNLVGLEMDFSDIVQLWKDGEEKACLKLRFLKFTSCSELRTIDLNVAPNLEALILEDCDKLEEVHFQVTPNLKELRIYDCNRLEKLHMPAENPKLRSLNLKNSMLTTLHLGITPNLETVTLKDCTHMVELRMSAKCPKLVNLDLDNLNLSTLHLGITPNLKTLRVNNCTDMGELRIPAECPKLITFDLFGIQKLRTLDLGLTPNLERLILEYCYDLEEINAPAECLKKLIYLYISHCGRFKTFEFDKERDLPEVASLSEFHLIANTGIFDPHDTWSEFQFSCYYKEDSASSFGNLERLVSLGSDARINIDYFSAIICGLQCLRKLTLEGGIPEAPKNLGRLDCLEELRLRSTDIKTLPDSICLLKHLKFLELESCLLLEKLPVDIGRLECLESLILSMCTLLQDLPNSICEIKHLKCLELSNLKLRTLHLGITQNLKTLSLNNCTDMVELHFPAEFPKLDNLKLSNLKLRTLHLGITPNLKTLILDSCTEMVELQIPSECPKLINLKLSNLKLTSLHLGIIPNLETLRLTNCTDKVEFQISGECPKLVNLDLDNSKLTKLHLGITPNLETLRVNECIDMVELQIPGECPKLVNLHLSCSKLKTLDLGNIPNLNRLDLRNCYNLVEINAPIGCLKKLVHLDLSGCRRFESFVFNRSPVEFRVGFLSEFNLIAEFRFKCFYKEGSVSPLGNLEKLLSFGFCFCRNTDSFLRSISGLRSFKKLKLEGCFTEAPKDLDQLECLEELVFWSTRIKHLPNSICMLKRLKFLELKSCWLIEKLPEDLVQLECLEELYLTECIFLRDIPESMCGMKRLKYFHLPYCILVEKLPEELGRLECLKDLNIEGTGISSLPLSIFRLKGLRILGTRWRLESYGFTSVIEHSRYTSSCYV